jgi:hypothetical protein
MVLNSDSLRVYTKVYLDSARARLGTAHVEAFRALPDSAMRIHRMQEGQVFYFRGDSLPEGLRRMHAAEMELLPMRETFHADVTRLPRTMEALELGYRAVAGAEFLEITPQLRETFGRSEGLLVIQVAPRSPASRAGLLVGDILTAAAGEQLRTLRQLRLAVAQSSTPVDLQVIRNKKKVELRLGATN